MSDSFSVPTSSSSGSMSGINSSTSMSSGSMAFNLSSPDFRGGVDSVHRIKDMNCNSSKGEQDYQKLVSHISTLSMSRDILNFFNLVVSCKEGTYGYKLMHILTTSKMNNMRGVSITRSKSEIKIIDPLDDNNIRNISHNSNLSYNDCKAGSVFVIYCHTYINKRKVSIFLKRYFKGYDKYYYIVNDKILTCFGKGCKMKEDSSIDDIDSSFLGDGIILPNSENNNTFWIFLFVIFVIIILIALAAYSSGSNNRY